MIHVLNVCVLDVLMDVAVLLPELKHWCYFPSRAGECKQTSKLS